VRTRGIQFAFIVAFVALVAAAVAMSITAQNDAADGPRDCINLRIVDQTQVVDERNILFFMRGRVTYRNTLAEDCPALRMSDQFTYRRSGSMSSLCKDEPISVLARNEPVSIATCRLGAFVPVSDDEVKALLAAAQAAKEQDSRRRRTSR